ncbi:hypothetical protein GCM10022221_34140 [Actinocorallia aurea]
METRRLKSHEVRRDMRDVLDFVRTGGTVIVEHYNRPVARITACRAGNAGPKVELYETGIDELTLTFGDQVWDLGAYTSARAGQFVVDAQHIENGDWEVDEESERPPTNTYNMAPVAEFGDGEILLFVDPMALRPTTHDYIGEAAILLRK